MDGAIIHLVASLFRCEKLLLARFFVTSLGRALTSMAVIFFIREFLASAVSERTGLTQLVADSFGAAAVLWIMAVLLLLTYTLGALLFYDNQVVVQRIIKVFELGVMERLIRHLLALSVPYADRQRSGEVIQTLRNDVTQVRMVVHAAANMLLESFVVAGLLIMAAWISPSLALWVLLGAARRFFADLSPGEATPCAVVWRAQNRIPAIRHDSGDPQRHASHQDFSG
jgi:ABC-type multidrug transport system fused ATPase/permease subunit